MPIVTWNVIFEHSFGGMFVPAPSSISKGSFGVLPNIKKYGLNPITGETVQLWACVKVATHSCQFFLAWVGNVPSILIRVALQCSH